MAMTNAEKQAAWRKRRQDELERLRAQQVQPQPAAPTVHNPGPFADCTEEEVDMLRAVLTEWRDNEPQRRAEQARRDDVVNACAEMQAQRAQEYAALSPAEKAMFDKEVADRRAAMEAARATAGQRRAEAKTARAERAALRDRLKPKAGTYWYAPYTTTGVERVTITVGPKGGIKAVNDAGYQLPCRFSTNTGQWEINGEPIYTSKEEGDRLFKGRSIGTPVEKPRPLKDKTAVELRRIRSEHHPDKGNAHADPALYQQAVEELDRRR